MVDSIERDVRVSYYDNLNRTKPFHSLKFAFKMHRLLGEVRQSVENVKF